VEKDTSANDLSVSVDADSTSSTFPNSGLPSPGRSSNRKSLAPGGTTKVLADLQAGVMNARNALENTKGQLRLSQRAVAQLTRQVEDMRDGRERLRLENEGLNNVVARKERLLQEVICSSSTLFIALTLAFRFLNAHGKQKRKPSSSKFS
jgi:hypothetical protein